ncbi:MAG TPA: CopD family protein, partial [Gemmatimonadales bacterium]|nr:CopD family protein [Gemmatimonadales bacterium]
MDGTLARWLTYAAALLVVGASVFRFGVLRALARSISVPGEFAPRAARVALVAAAVLGLVAAPLRLLAQARSFLDPGQGLTLDLIGTVLGTDWGHAWTVQVLASGLAAAGALFATVAPSGWFPAAVGATTIVLSMPLTGHATGAEEAGAWGYPLDALHILGAGSWLGTLAVLTIVALIPLARSTEESRAKLVAELVHAFHPVALTGAGVTVVAGVALSLRYLQGDFAALVVSKWGQTLLIKLALLGGVAALGAWNSRVMRHKLGTDEASGVMRKSAATEL